MPRVTHYKRQVFSTISLKRLDTQLLVEWKLPTYIEKQHVEVPRSVASTFSPSKLFLLMIMLELDKELITFSECLFFLCIVCE